jgi:hypothetical protein
MSSAMQKTLPALALILTLGWAGPAGAQQITLVNMMPQSSSSETNQDSEPSVAVNPVDRQQIVATAFTPDETGPNAPIFYSLDGGLTWHLNAILPGNVDFMTNDVTVRFSGSGNRLYAGVLRGSFFPEYYMLRTTDFTQPVLMDTIHHRDNVDQPWVMTATVIGQTDAGKDRLYVGMNDHDASAGHTASVEMALDAAVASSVADVSAARLESRGMDGTDLAPVRITTHPDGTVYAIFYSVQGSDFDEANQTLDAVVVRDDFWGTGPQPFTALKDSDNKAGFRLAKDIIVPVNSGAPGLGSQRLGGGGISIAVDPQDSGRVFAAYSDKTNGTYTLHIWRSTTRGQSWTQDILKVTNAVNPTLAVNVQGKAGLLYQRFITGTKKWETHLRRWNVASDPSTGTDVILATFVDGTPFPQSFNYLGDYAHLQAVGKDFYGVFSSSNQPDPANFPTIFPVFKRNVDVNNHVLKNLNNTGTVAVSIDPFFFHTAEQDPGDDFYARDWTESPASGDNGAEPSAKAIFYKTSDVWNRRSIDPGTFPNDKPEGEKAGNGDGTLGDNWAFARIRRNTGGAARTVTAHFLVSQFGVGNPYVDASSMDPDVTLPAQDPTLSFAAGETGPKTTDPYPWHLADTDSTHLCLAVEIKSTNDPYLGSTLRGSAPGWPTDLVILNDNNRAQRNLYLSKTPAGVQKNGMKKSYAIVHNMATFPRDMTLAYTLSDPVRLAGATARVVASVASSLGELRASEPQRLAESGTVTLPTLQPGESRWLEIDLPATPGKEGTEGTADFQEMVDGQRLDGFAVGALALSTEKAVAEVLESHRSEHNRLAAVYGSGGAEEEMKAAQEALDRGAFDAESYVRFLGDHLKSMAGVLDQLGRALDGDPFGVRADLDALFKLYEAGAAADDLAVAHASYLEELDALVTLRQLEQGNRADLLHNVRWQRDLFLRAGRLAALPEAGALVDASRAFATGFEQRTLDDRDYPSFLRETSDALRKVAGELETVLPDLTAREKGIEEAVATGDLTAMQKAHRDFLSQLQTLDSGL